jgi:hypothetical protein
MQELQTENEQPLLVVKYVWWRVLWRLFIPYVPGIFMFYGFGGYFVKENNPIAYITMYAFMLFAIGMTINLLLTRDFRFFHDRIERRWFLFGTRMLKFDEIIVGLTYMNMKAFNSKTIVFSKRIKCFISNIRLDRNLISKKTEQIIVQLLAGIPHRDISEFQENLALEPFFKNQNLQTIDVKKCWWLKAI